MNESLQIQIAKQLNYLLSVEKLYLHTDLTLNRLAEMLQTNRTYLSEVIQAYFGVSFTTLINSYRIREAKVWLQQGKEKIRIEELASMVGFNSKSSFNSAFKRYTGLTPSEYRQSNQKEITETLINL